MPSRNLSATLTNLVSVTGNGNVVFSGSPTIDSPIIRTNINLPTGNTAQRPASANAGNLRFNNELTSFEGYNGTKWGSIGGGLAPTAIKTANGYIAVANDLVRCNTAGGAFSISFPSIPSDGDIIGVVDVAETFSTNNLTLLPNGKSIESDATSIILDMDGTYVSFVYNLSTSNWRLLETPLGTGFLPTRIISSSYTASINDIVRCNTAAGAFAVTLPADPVDGSIIKIIDIAGTFYANNLTIIRGGTNTIENDTSVILDINNTAVEFIYNTSTTNWRLIQTPFGVFAGNVTANTSVTGMVKITGTVLANAVPGTDYLTPPSGTSILKANSSGALANAVAGVDYLTPPSGTSILKANSSGALANAVAGVDYLTPPSGTSILKANSSGALANAVAGVDYMAAVTPGANNNILTSNGTSWVSATSTAASTGKAIAIAMVMGF